MFCFVFCSFFCLLVSFVSFVSFVLLLTVQTLHVCGVSYNNIANLKYYGLQYFFQTFFITRGLVGEWTWTNQSPKKFIHAQEIAGTQAVK